MKRRTFMTAVAATTGAGAIGAARSVSGDVAGEPAAARTPAEAEPVAGMPRRQLGKTGRYLSIIGYAGFALRDKERTQAECTASLGKALESGINFFDVAPAYDNGLCETRMGQGFSEIGAYRRESIFLACKTRQRTRSAAQEEFERSLRRLKTEYFDLYQLHCLIDPKTDVEAALSMNGAMEMVLEAREQGKIKHIGFSAHTTRAALAALQAFRFDSVMFPINFVEHFAFGFGKNVCDLAARQGAGVLAIKPMSAGAWPADMPWNKRPRRWWYQSCETQEDIDLSFRFALAQPAVVSGIPPAFLDLAERAWQAGRNWRPLSADDAARLREMAQQSGTLFKDGDATAVRRRRHAEADGREGCPGMMS